MTVRIEALAKRVDASQQWKTKGHSSAAEHLAAISGRSLGAARSELETSVALDDLPATKEALLGGGLSESQGHVIANAAKVNPDAERHLISQAKTGNHQGLRDEARKAKAAADKDPEATHRRIHSERRLSRHTDVHAALEALPSHYLGAPNLMGVVATVAAWTEGDEWLAAVLQVLDENRTLLADLLERHFPGSRYRPPDATYLAWIDLRRAGCGDDPAADFRQRGVELSPGPQFGPQGTGHVRLNFATSPTILERIVETMAG